MACHLGGAKPLSEPMQEYCWSYKLQWTNFSEILIKIKTFSFKKMHLIMASGKWRPFCLGLNVLKCEWQEHIDGLFQERCNSSVSAMELHLPCTNLLMWAPHVLWQIPLNFKEVLSFCFFLEHFFCSNIISAIYLNIIPCHSGLLGIVSI